MNADTRFEKINAAAKSKKDVMVAVIKLLMPVFVLVAVSGETSFNFQRVFTSFSSFNSDKYRNGILCQHDLSTLLWLAKIFKIC